MDASTLTTPAQGLVDALRRRRPNGWTVFSDGQPDEIELAEDSDTGLSIEPDCVELVEAKQAARHAEDRLARHGEEHAPAFVWDRRPYLLTSGLGSLLASLGFATSPFAGTSPAAAFLGVLTAGALALASDRLGRDLRLAWRAGQINRVSCWSRVAGTGLIATGLSAGATLMLGGHAPIWALLLLTTLLTLAIAGWRRQDPDPERQRLAAAVQETQAKVEALEATRRQELENVKAKVDQLLADLAEA